MAATLASGDVAAVDPAKPAVDPAADPAKPAKADPAKADPAAVDPAKKAADDAAEVTRRAALTDEERQAEDTAKAAADAKDKKGAPEKYEAFKVPEGVTLDAEITTAFETKAKALGLSQQDAQELFDLGAQVTAKNTAQMTAKVSETQASWLAAAKADKEFGGEKIGENMAVCKKALDAFATPEFRTILNESKLGNHPEIIRVLYRVGKAMSEDGHITASKGGERDTSDEGRAKRIYG